MDRSPSFRYVTPDFDLCSSAPDSENSFFRRDSTILLFSRNHRSSWSSLRDGLVEREILELPDRREREFFTPGSSPAHEKVIAVNRTFLVVLLTTMSAVCVAAAPPPADSILLNGEVLVFKGVERNDGNGRPEFAEALAIRDGRIVFLGGNAAARKLAGPNTIVTDLGGRMVMPGIIDGHFHGTRSADCEMGYQGGTVAEVLAKLQACLDGPKQAAYKGTNVRFYATQFFGEAVLPAGRVITRDDLDRLDTTRPIRLRNADGHKSWLNSRALGNAGIDDKTPVPPGGQIGRDANGQPNGFVADMDVGNWGDTVPDTESARVELVRRTIADANRMGITSVFVPGGGQDQAPAWTAVQDEGGLTLRVNLGLSVDSFVHDASDLAKLRKEVAALADYRRYAKGLIAVSSVKVYCDGVMEYPAQTAAMLKPYNMNAGSRENPVWKPGTARGPDPACSDAKQGFVELDRAGWQIHVHALGDRATREALDGFQAAREANGPNDLRHTLTHLQAIDAADIPRFAALGIVASMSLQWARRDAYSVDYTTGYIDDEVYERLYPAFELWKAGAIVAGGSDYPVDPLLPMVQIETAVDHTGEAIPGVYPGALSPKEAVPDLLAVIRMHTINAAYEMHMERDTGSIEVGKYADLVVLSQNLFAVPTERISDTSIVKTILGGKVVYDAANAR
jgi:predicted amidohydrolase YtcJ